MMAQEQGEGGGGGGVGQPATLLEHAPEHQRWLPESQHLHGFDVLSAQVHSEIL